MIDLLKNIYYGKENLLNHITLFSIIGIFSLAFGKITSVYVFSDYFGNPPYDNFSLCLITIIILIIAIYLCGYMFTYSHNIFANNDKRLPEFHLNSYVVFVKMLPVFIVWTTYFSALCLFGFSALTSETTYFYAYYTLIFSFLPFITIIYIMYSRRFELKYLLFNPLALVKIIRKMFIPVVKFSLVIALAISILWFVLIKGLNFTGRISNHSLHLSIRILALTIFNYAGFICQLLFVQNFANIIKNKSK